MVPQSHWKGSNHKTPGGHIVAGPPDPRLNGVGTVKGKLEGEAAWSEKGVRLKNHSLLAKPLAFRESKSFGGQKKVGGKNQAKQAGKTPFGDLRSGRSKDQTVQPQTRGESIGRFKRDKPNETRRTARPKSQDPA